MEWHPMFCSVYITLIIITAGFVLTVCSWLAPPVTIFVDNVRIIGISALAVGAILLSILCIIAAVNQGKCFWVCYSWNTEKEVPSCLTELIGDPLLNTTAIIASNTQPNTRNSDIIENKLPYVDNLCDNVIENDQNNSASNQ